MMKISDLLIGMIIFTGIVAGMGIFYGDLASTYGKTDVKNLSFINVTSNVTSFYEDLQTNTTNNFGAVGTFFTSIGIIIGAVTQLATFPGVMMGFVNDVTATLVDIGIPIPGWFVNMIIGVITVLVVFLLISFFTNREG